MSRIFANQWSDYELIDAGGDQKLERWGNVVTIRPERNAYFGAVLSKKEWYQKADLEFIEETKSKGSWKVLKEKAPTSWNIGYNGVQFKLELTNFKHVGLFPEQQLNWQYLEEQLKPGQRFLNLFAYTGAASVVARNLGADVFHCDSVKQVIGWGKENMELSGLSDIHWVLEDALKFAQREAKRGNKYDGIIMDPPAFGIGAKKERWKIENRFPELLEAAMYIKKDKGFIIANTYSPRLEEPQIKAITKTVCANQQVEIATLSQKTTTGKRLDYGQRTLIY
ncbi:MAG: class I SAM-dependent methyltransferase [Crocinitomicaceae bacterium]